MAPLRKDGPIIIVEDDDGVREVLETILRVECFDVSSVCDAEEGLARMRREPTPCAILLDLHMPGMDGFKFREEQMKDADLREIPVMLYSGHDDVRMAARQMGIEAFLEKPFGIEAILAFLHKYAKCKPSTL